ncbi:hypothetical protein [Nonomuraea dietziae]|uniref:Uncharacterized protein n=1 Tax=Nonomuraea dietziae TaxID=65515 RepID=A0A7W5VFB0_9ACTN|nr:hypothetical protein [Nonomuraea dietziae]MBB3733841.1 hypothetical protein [Nonomuraea dietziae]
MTTRHEAVFSQDYVADDTDTDALVASSYLATATRTGKYWTATVHGLPDGQSLHVQGATWRETADNALDRVSDLLGPSTGVVGLYLAPADPEAASVVKAVREARTARFLAEQAERDAVVKAAQTLLDQGWTTRDVGSVLGFSHQRISQIARRTTA